MLRLFVRLELMDDETAHGMLAWPHSGFHVHDGVWVAAQDSAFAVRLARYCSNLPICTSRCGRQLPILRPLIPQSEFRRMILKGRVIPRYALCWNALG